MRAAVVQIFCTALLLASCAKPASSPTDAGPVVPPDLQGLVPGACADPSPFNGAGYDPKYALPPSSAFTRKLFPMLAMLAGNSAIRSAIANDGTLGPLGAQQRAALGEARGCGGDAACIKTKLTSFDAVSVRDALTAAFGSETHPLVQQHLRPSGAFMRWADNDAPTLVGGAWDFTLTTLESTFDRAASELSAADLDSVVQSVTVPADEPWFEPLRAVTEAALLKAGRNEAIRYEPIDLGENKAALAHLSEIHPDDYPFALILLPGQGPDDAGTEISPLSIQRADQAAARWKAGLAPIIVPSGGHVHPDKTKYSEAIEMKHYLMQIHDIPEWAIVVDPYARHTTTNVRNAGRLQLQLGLPPDKPLLFTSDMFQAPYIGDLLGPRSQNELGYLPWRNIAMYDTGLDGCLTVSRDLLFVDASDPLDP